mmetsp:Transcript_10476/g.30431  ORF Transcript_10476/g.30431 Transcript_10476/m.30431 type:complete len:230 (+) Transcript_10476:498-1187(+)
MSSTWSKLHSKLRLLPTGAPPATPVGPQPAPKWLQHHSRFATDHPRSEFARPAWQSKGGDLVGLGVAVAVVEQPTPEVSQQNAFFIADQPRSHRALPTPQSKPGAVVATRAAVVATTGGTGSAGTTAARAAPTSQWVPNSRQHHHRRSVGKAAVRPRTWQSSAPTRPCATAGASAAALLAATGVVRLGERARSRTKYAHGSSTITAMASQHKRRWQTPLVNGLGGSGAT